MTLKLREKGHQTPKLRLPPQECSFFFPSGLSESILTGLLSGGVEGDKGARSPRNTLTALLGWESMELPPRRSAHRADLGHIRSFQNVPCDAEKRPPYPKEGTNPWLRGTRRSAHVGEARS